MIGSGRNYRNGVELQRIVVGSNQIDQRKGRLPTPLTTLELIKGREAPPQIVKEAAIEEPTVEELVDVKEAGESYLEEETVTEGHDRVWNWV
ncbi:hypothetical protein CDL15_Pgr010903 [Punica granatum]|uniref:Uncharacterized protein n=1 Tax=Punica granatum TaxID=22663 RepID=A0A218XN33_PUNGR|nr:hypothetical protein CDL15_Pgr010903 [Punica granatum]